MVEPPNKWSIHSKPKIMPAVDPIVQKMIECHSTTIRIQRMVKEADVIPETGEGGLFDDM